MINSEALESFIETAFSRSLSVLDQQKVFQPLLFTQQGDNEPKTDPLTANSLEEAFAEAQNLINDKVDELSLYAVVWDAEVGVEGEKYKAIMVEFGSDQDAQGAVIAQRYTWQDGNPVAFDRPIMARQVQSRLGAVGPFTRLQWLDIVKAPVLAFVTIGGADGNYDDEKLAVFSKYLADPTKAEGKVTQLALAHAGPLMQEIIAHSPKTPLEVLAGIQKAQTLLKEKEPSEYRAFCEDLYAIAAAVAKKSTGNEQAVKGMLATLGKQLSDSKTAVQ
ncbi:hypothetical protein [Salinibius halmophilus]|uniref:hypothetical protein n=1 Tax=Salinibius halmophilus TaxID=1853216 RepID=UPI000E673D59|nr:hypothetical protein [Salinibius halmophilus]